MTNDFQKYVFLNKILRLALSTERNTCYLFSGLQATVAAAPMIGYLPGGLIFGTMSDKIGRKPTFLICNTVSIN